MHKQTSCLDPAFVPFTPLKPPFWYHPLAAEGFPLPLPLSLVGFIIFNIMDAHFPCEQSESFWFQPDYSHFLEDELDK